MDSTANSGEDGAQRSPPPRRDDDVLQEWTPDGFVLREKSEGDVYVHAGNPADLTAWR